jgi:hypothetical protein
MSEWFYHLPVLWMAGVVLIATVILTWLVFAVVTGLAVDERARMFKAVTPALLSPLGIVFGLLVAFLSAQVWNDSQRAGLEVTREASALRTVELLAETFPQDLASRVHELLRSYVKHTVEEDWPAMARGAATLAFGVAVGATPVSDGQRVAQREMVTALEQALDARRQRIIISRSSINETKWAGLIGMAIVALVGIAMAHCDNKPAAAMAMALFAAAVAISVLLIASHARPFTGQISVGPGLLQEIVR